MSTYSTHAAVCARFYELSAEAQAAGPFVLRASAAAAGEDMLFVGSMFAIAEHLRHAGLRLTLADYSHTMLVAGRSRLPGAAMVCADLRALPWRASFDRIVVAGRVFSHLTSDADLIRALRSCRQALRPAGTMFLDNYETSRIQRTDYFNGTVRVTDEAGEIVRRSHIEVVSSPPFVVRWQASYNGRQAGADAFAFSDTMLQRAWSREEIARLLAANDFALVTQSDNFDDTSFYTLARAT